MRPSAIDVSSAEIPNAPATGAAYWNDSPSIATFVFALLLAAASTSAKCPESFADNPKAVRASVTISDVRARSSPDAAARFMMPPIPLIISSDFHPAIAMYSMAAPASVAEKDVVDPISLALAFSASNSSPVAPDMDWTVDICASKSFPTLTA